MLPSIRTSGGRRPAAASRSAPQRKPCPTAQAINTSGKRIAAGGWPLPPVKTSSKQAITQSAAQDTVSHAMAALGRVREFRLQGRGTMAMRRNVLALSRRRSRSAAAACWAANPTCMWLAELLRDRTGPLTSAWRVQPTAPRVPRSSQRPRWDVRVVRWASPTHRQSRGAPPLALEARIDDRALISSHSAGARRVVDGLHILTRIGEEIPVRFDGCSWAYFAGVVRRERGSGGDPPAEAYARPQD